jgi:ribosomal protein L37AE/L43A
MPARRVLKAPVHLLHPTTLVFGGFMSNQAIRGTSLNSSSMSSDVGVELEARQIIEFNCSSCNTTMRIPFALEVELPEKWTCSKCGHEAWRPGITATVDPTEKVGKTPFEMLLERRSREELEEILQERLSYLRARRGLETETYAS